MTTYIGVPRGGGGAGSARLISAFYPLGAGTVMAAVPIPDNGWRSRQANQNPGFSAAQIGMSASWLWAGTPYFRRYINIPAGAAGTLYALTDESISETPRVQATGCAEPLDKALYIWRGVWRWSNNTPYPGANNGTIIGWCWQPAAGSILPTPQTVYRYVGLVRTSAGVFFGYRNTGAAQLFPLTGFTVDADNLIECRFRPATASRAARFELLINGVSRFQRDWTDPDMPQPPAVATNEFFVPVLMRYGTPAISNINTRDWEMIVGPDEASTL
jgi:hypothetical protein